MKKGLVIGIIVVVALIILGIIFYPSPSSPEQRCKVDSDCVFVDVCCSCENGGFRGAVNKDYLDYVNELFVEGCARPNSINCTGIPSNSSSCGEDVVPICFKGWCHTSDVNTSNMIIPS